MKLLKNKIFWGLIASALGVVLGYIYLYPIQFNLCTADFTTMTFDNSCLRKSALVGVKLFYPAVSLSLVFLSLLFIPHAVSAWRKFAIWYVPIIGLLIVLSSPGDAGWIIGPTYQQYIQGVSSIYVLVSLLIIGRMALKSKKS